MPSTEPTQELKDALDIFRQQWIEEAAKKRAAASSGASVSASPTAAGATVPQSPVQSKQLDAPTSPQKQRGRSLEKDFEDKVTIKNPSPPPAPKSAIELYDTAVTLERSGKLNDALSHYRAAFKLDDAVDQAWNRRNAAQTKSPTRRNQSLPGASPSSPDKFSFQRTLHLGPDYHPPQDHGIPPAEAATATAQGITEPDSTHPLSTGFLRNSLAKSFAKNPYVGPNDEPPEPSPYPIRPEDALAELAFIVADPELPMPIANLPREVLIHIIKDLAFTSVIPPPPKKVDEEQQQQQQVDAVEQAAKPKFKRLLQSEVRNSAEVNLDLEEVNFGWKMDVEALERFGRTCRFARILTLDDTLWRELCSRAYFAPRQLEEGVTSTQLLQKYGFDPRRSFVEHPRIRLDGAFISVVTYVRTGDSGQAWYSPEHLVTFYRYFRFYPSGLALTLLTVDPPENVVRNFNPSLKMKGFNIGQWKLVGDILDIWDLEDPWVPEHERKYSFQMKLRLKSTHRGRFNKLEMLSMATENRSNLELEDVPIAPTKPFYFSKVASYAADL
ncbi:hypothetical protein T439DRAFT_380527 [Meredithblackwellia eburnea MCA 4105]